MTCPSVWRVMAMKRNWRSANFWSCRSANNGSGACLMVSRRTASRDQLTNSPSSRLSKVQQPEIERVSDAALTPQLPLKPVEGRKDKTRQLGVAFQTEDRESPSLRNQERRAGQPPPMKC